MASIAEYKTLDLELLTLSDDYSILYKGKKLYLQTPESKFKKIKTENNFKTKTMDTLWNEFIIKFETKIKKIIDDKGEIYKRSSAFIHTVADAKTTVVSNNMVKLQIYDLIDNKFKSIVSCKCVKPSLKEYYITEWKLHTIKSSYDVNEEPDEPEPEFNASDIV